MDYSKLFTPRSIAIVGASRREKTVGNDVVKNLVQQGYPGEIYPVNPKAEELYGQKVYADIDQIDAEIDLVVVAIPAKYVSQTIEQAASKGAGAAIVISAGFKEIGNDDLEQELAQVCKKHDIVLIGPNCLGVINADHQMNASFAGLMPKVGDIAFVSQSGALCTAVLDYAQELDLGFSKFLSIGNKAAVDELTLLQVLAKDEDTKVIAFYAEQLTDAPAFIKAAKEIARSDNPKPIIVLKSGKSEEGAAAIASHTGSLSGGDVAYDALFKQAGIIRAACIRELFEYAQTFSQNDLHDAKNVAIITNAGGPGVLTTDEVSAHGLKLAKLSEKSQSSLRSFLPEAASVNNPVDVLGDAPAERYEKTLEVVANDKNVDGMIVLLTPQSMTEIEKTAKAVIDIKQKHDKPIIVSFMGQATVQPGVDTLRQAGITTTTFPEPAANVLSKLDAYHHFTQLKQDEVYSFSEIKQESAKELISNYLKNDKTNLPEADAMPVLEAYGFETLQSGQAKTVAEAQKVVAQIGKPCAMKIVSEDILHKSDVGGVALNVTAENIKTEFEQMMKTVKSHKPKAKIDGVLLVEMAPKGGLELIVGANKQPGLGTLIMVGLGGIYVEVFKDVSFGFAPLTKHDIERMITELKSHELMQGARGQEALDEEALKKALGRMSQLIVDHSQIMEVDINPLLLLPDGAKLLDARIVLEK